MRKIIWLLLLLCFLPVTCFAATSKTLTARKTQTPTGYIITYYDENGTPTIATNKGYASAEYEIENGRTAGERYFDEQNRPITISGYDEKRNVYDGDKLVRVEFYKDGKLKKNASGYAIVIRTVDDKNHVVQEMYYDENEQLTNRPGGHYGLRRDEFDDQDRVIRFTHLGADGQPITLTAGYTSVTREYDDAGRSKIEMYFDKAGKPAVLSLGHSGIQYIRDDETGKTIGMVYLDANGNPMTTSQGYASVRYDLDEWDNVIKHSYYDIDGNPVALGRGQYGQVFEYEGKTKVRSYYVDADGNELFFLDQYLSEHPTAVLLSAILLTALTAFLPRRFRLILSVLYIIFIFYMTLFVRESGEQRLNLNLFWSYRQVLTDWVLAKEVINNILLFIPLGALLYSINPKLLWIAPLLSASVESIQYIGGFGLCELDDLFGNTLGSVIGWCTMWAIHYMQRTSR